MNYMLRRLGKKKDHNRILIIVNFNKFNILLKKYNIMFNFINYISLYYYLYEIGFLKKFK